MQLINHRNADRAPGASGLPIAVASLYYVMRAPGGGVREAQIDALADPRTAQLVPGPFADALRAAQLRAGAVVDDGIHRGSISQSQAILDAGDGAWRIVALVGDHRDAIGPVFIDGAFFDKVGLAVHGKRLVAELQAVVGAESWMDLRRPLRARAEPITPTSGAEMPSSPAAGAR